MEMGELLRNVPRGTSDLFGNDDGEFSAVFSLFAGAFDGNAAFVHGFDCFIHGIKEKAGVFDAKLRF